MQSKYEYQWRGIGFAVVGTVLFSLKSIFIKLLYLEGLTADAVLVLRMTIALPLYLMIFIYCLQNKTGSAHFNRRSVLLTILAGGMGYYLASLLDLMGLTMITAQLERLTLFSYPFFVALIGIIVFKEAVTLKLLLGFVISYFGLGLVMLQEGMLLDHDIGQGVGLVLASAVVFAIYLTMSKGLIHHFGSVMFTSFAMSISSVMVFLHGYMTIDMASLVVSDMAWLWLFLLAILSTVIPSFMISEAIGRIGPSRASAIGLMGPVFTMILAVSFLGEPFTMMITLGGLLVVFGVGMIQTKEGQKAG